MTTAPPKSQPPATIPDNAPQPHTAFQAAAPAATAADNKNVNDDDNTAAMFTSCQQRGL